MEKKFKHIPAPVLMRKQGEVQYPVSYEYNGGIQLEDGWFNGFQVDAPIVPDGYELVGIGVGLEFNAHPPLATMVMRKKKE